jgi:hypothetical protein
MVSEVSVCHAGKGVVEQSSLLSETRKHREADEGRDQSKIKPQQ